MSLIHLLLIAVVQGLTEFLPVSSSGHLILISELTALSDQGLAIDVAVHLGTLIAVITYFWADLRPGFAGIPRMLSGRIDTPGARLAFLLTISTLPVMAAGLLMKLTGLDALLRSAFVIGWAMLGFGLILWWADRTGSSEKAESDWSTRDAILLGLWQVIALIPGTSRSGICITGARRLGYERSAAARISMLMSVPTILAAGGLLTLDVIGGADWPTLRAGFIGAIFAGLAAFIALALMMRLLKTVDYTPYVYYRIALGAFLIWYGAGA